MATVTERLEQVLEREAPEWGVRPAPEEVRRLSNLDFAVLWGDLGIGLLVLVTGALLVPALGLPQALLAIVLGSVIGCVPLALVGRAGAREGVPGMVLLRPALGIRGSYLPTVLNIGQLIGWTAFELWAMALVASRVSGPLFGPDSFYVWLGVAALVCLGLSLGGPILVVRRWMERFGAWVIAVVAGWLTIRLLTTADLGALWSRPGDGGFPTFWTAVDLVIVMPVSWIPLVADYNRFARRGVSSAAGTYGGYLVSNVWFYALGALLVLGAGVPPFPGPAAVADGIVTLTGGALVLVALLVGETDEAFADIYSAAVSTQNLAPRLRQRALVVGVSAVGVGLGVWLFRQADQGITTYENFLFLIGSIFVPLFGVFLADYIVLRRGRGLGRTPRVSGARLGRTPRGSGARLGRTPRGSGARFEAQALFDTRGPYRYLRGFNPAALVAWILGFAVYHWILPTGPGAWTSAAETFFIEWLHLPVLAGKVPASVVSFAVAFGAYVLIAVLVRRRSSG